MKLKTLWYKLTDSHANNEREARREHSTKVVLGVSTIMFIVTTPIMAIARLIAPGEVTIDMPLAAGLFSIILVVSWLIAYKGRWRFSSFIPPVLLFSLAVWDTYYYGLGATNLAEYTIAILITVLLLGEKAGWIAVLFSITSGLFLEWRLAAARSIDIFEDLVYWAALLLVFYLLVVLLVRFLVTQYQNALRSSYKLMKTLEDEIREHKITERKLKDTLENNEILLRELYHRTKNNMQTISAFLDVQSAYLQDERLESVVNSVDQRIQAMALVHQKLFESKDLSRINLGEYITDLCYMVLNNMDVDPNRVAITFDLEEVSVLIDIAIPCGIIVTELLSNAVKHGFSNNRKGTVGVFLSRSADHEIILRVRDNGVGVGGDFDFRSVDSFGLTILRQLVESQLRGTLSFDADQGSGVACTITFRDNLYKPRV
jgi:two-component sensor histidine kinase